jgi:hypothetical protein
MQIFIFDMDGVLLDPQGYHRALQETVRLVSQSLGFDEYHLPDEAIARFEALGISSEFHSSALCMALMLIEAHKQGFQPEFSTTLKHVTGEPRNPTLDLPGLLALIDAQSMLIPALTRSMVAIQQYAVQARVDPGLVTSLVRECESLEQSLTFNVFQELVLGSEVFENTYGKSPQFGQESYLNQYDRSYISPELMGKLRNWFNRPEHGAAIMTNRPSSQLLGFPGTPEAELGAALVGLEFLPILGYGEITWLADQKDVAAEAGELQKPAPQHALSAILAASGMPEREALLEAHQRALGKGNIDVSKLDGSRVIVFEDTPAGIMAVENAQKALDAQGIEIEIEKAGIAGDAIKAEALEAIGAKVFASVGEALNAVL